METNYRGLLPKKEQPRWTAEPCFYAWHCDAVRLHTGGQFPRVISNIESMERVNLSPEQLNQLKLLRPGPNLSVQHRRKMYPIVSVFGAGKGISPKMCKPHFTVGKWLDSSYDHFIILLRKGVSAIVRHRGQVNESQLSEIRTFRNIQTLPWIVVSSGATKSGILHIFAANQLEQETSCLPNEATSWSAEEDPASPLWGIRPRLNKHHTSKSWRQLASNFGPESPRVAFLALF